MLNLAVERAGHPKRGASELSLAGMVVEPKEKRPAHVSKQRQAGLDDCNTPPACH